MIRLLTPDDLPAVKTLIGETELFPAELLDAMTAPFFSGEAGDDVWLTDDDGGPQAVAYYAPERLTAGTWNLLLIAVRPSQQGQGRGAALLRFVEHALASRGERLLLVETSGLSSFARTRAFYERNGYTQEARIRDYYQEGEDKVVFWRRLSAHA